MAKIKITMQYNIVMAPVGPTPTKWRDADTGRSRDAVMRRASSLFQIRELWNVLDREPDICDASTQTSPRNQKHVEAQTLAANGFRPTGRPSQFQLHKRWQALLWLFCCGR